MYNRLSRARKTRRPFRRVWFSVARSGLARPVAAPIRHGHLSPPDDELYKSRVRRSHLFRLSSVNLDHPVELEYVQSLGRTNNKS